MSDLSFGAAGVELVAELTDFTFALRLAGLEVTIDRSMSFLRAVAVLESVDHVQLFWAGRSSLCCEPGDFDIYDDTFNWFFRREVPAQMRRSMKRRSPVKLVATDPGAGTGPADRSPLEPAVPELVHHQDLADLTDGERAELTGLLRLLDPDHVDRRPARRPPTGNRQPGAARPLRAVLNGLGGGVPRRRGVGIRSRKLVLLIDISQSMAPYADPLVRFAHAAKRKLGNRCEVFTLGPGMTRLSETLARRDPQPALDAAARAIAGWPGDTRLGPALQAFLDQHGQRGMARGAVVIVFSDGFERGSADLLAEQARRLSRLTRSLIWVNPHQNQHGYALAQRGIVAVQPFCDHLLAGHSLAALGELMDIAHDA